MPRQRRPCHHVIIKGVIEGQMRVFVIPRHAELAKGTLLGILHQAGLNREQFIDRPAEKPGTLVPASECRRRPDLEFAEGRNTRRSRFAAKKAANGQRGANCRATFVSAGFRAAAMPNRSWADFPIRLQRRMGPKAPMRLAGGCRPKQRTPFGESDADAGLKSGQDRNIYPSRAYPIANRESFPTESQGSFDEVR